MVQLISLVAVACYAVVAIAMPATPGTGAVAPRATGAATVNAVLSCDANLEVNPASQTNQTLFNQTFQEVCVGTYACQSFNAPTLASGEWVGACLGCAANQADDLFGGCVYDEQS